MTNTASRKGEHRVSLSWSNAEALVNELRERVDRPGLELAQSHLTRQEEEPPKSRAAEEAPVDDPKLWERVAHEEADRTTSGK
ncbi:MAG: hypothetical protein M3168_00425 [Actinomycetota bacterium]|nr:hypothetical protein [Actinomycetota bacterium]